MSLVFIIIVIWIIYLVWEYCYFQSQKFLEIKHSIQDYTDNCNDLNNHIEELKNTYINVKRIDYGSAEYMDNSKYNFKRPELKKMRESSNVYECSLNVCKNAQQQPFKYICKYFNIDISEETLSNFENVFNNFSAAEQGKILLKNERTKIINEISCSIPFIIRNFRTKKLARKLGFEDIDFSQLYFPKYVFKYISPGGNSSMSCDVTLDINNLERFIDYLSNLIKFKKSVAGQRALMTSSLREKIKKRDNYTCQQCGASLAVESNLLLEIDHIIPLSKGGITAEDNLQTLCWKCNRSKGAKIFNNISNNEIDESYTLFEQDKIAISEICRLFEIIEESQDLVNHSANVETVKNRLDLLLDKIKQVMEYSEKTLNSAGKTKSTLPEQYDRIIEIYDIIINQAIGRAFEKEKKNAETLKTQQGRTNRLHKFFEKTRKIEWLSPENKKYLSDLERTAFSDRVAD